MIQCEMMYWWGIFHFLISAWTNRAKVFPFRTEPDRKVADARWTRLKVGAHPNFIWQQNETSAPVLLGCSYIFHPYLQFSVEEILWRHGHTIMDSFEAIWPLSLTLKAQHLLVLDVKLNPLMISSLLRSHGKFLLDYIVGKGFELDIELKQTFFFLQTPKVLAVSYSFISFI